MQLNGFAGLAWVPAAISPIWAKDHPETQVRCVGEQFQVSWLLLRGTDEEGSPVPGFNAGVPPENVVNHGRA